MTTHHLPVYDKVFGGGTHSTSTKQLDWFPDNNKKSYSVDFSTSDWTSSREGEKSTLEKIALIAVKTILLPWLVYDGVKYITSYFFMQILLPAQQFTESDFTITRSEQVEKFKSQGIYSRFVTLKQNGIQYSGLLFGRKENIKNGKWVIDSIGNNAAIEHIPSDPNHINPYLNAGFNVLLVNYPNVGLSKGSVTPNGLGDSQEVGISFLETAVKAKKIVLSGHTLGSAAMGEAILSHHFQRNIEYLVIRRMGFDRLSHLAEKSIGSLGRFLVGWLGFEMDSVAASKKLQNLGIHEIVIQGGKDKIMKGVELADALRRKKMITNKTLNIVPGAKTNDMLPRKIEWAIWMWDSNTLVARCCRAVFA